MDQPTSVPTNKVAAAGIGGSAAVVLIYLVHVLLNIDMPAEVASAVTALLAFAAGYLMREKAPTAAEVAKGVVNSAKGN